MTTEEKKKELQALLLIADDGLTDVLLEAAVEYNKKIVEEFEIPKEWIAEFEQRSADLRTGKDKGFTYEATIERAKQILKEKANVIYNSGNLLKQILN